MPQPDRQSGSLHVEQAFLPATATSQSPSLIPSAAVHRIAVRLAVFVFFFAVVAFLQWQSGAFTAEFGHDEPDEPAHILNGVMLRDYIAQGLPGNPMRFAENFYLHYPKIAFGMWPPLLHFLEAAWLLVFPVSPVSILLFSAFLTTLLATLVALSLQRFFPWEAGIAAGLGVIATPVVASNATRVMADILVAAMVFGAALAFARYLRTAATPDSLRFGVAAALCILAKNNGCAVVFLPPVALALTGQWRLLKRRNFWYPVPIVALIAGPWLALSQYLMRDVHYREWAPLEAATVMAAKMAHAFGWTLLPLISAGIFVRVLRPLYQRRLDPVWACFAALILSVWMFHSVIPQEQDARYTIPAVGALAAFLIAGVSWCAERCAEKFGSLRIRRVLLLAMTSVMFAGTGFRVWPKCQYGYREVVRHMLATATLPKPVVLISSENRGEGMFITELALAEARPGHTVLRAGKTLSLSDWRGQRYRLTYRTPDEVAAFLDAVPVNAVVLDRTPPGNGDMRWPHHELLARTLASHSNAWRLASVFPSARIPSPIGTRIEVYERTADVQTRPLNIRLELPHTLGRDIQN
jgi:hypothetical protein